MKKYLLLPVLVLICLCLISCSEEPAVPTIFQIHDVEFTTTPITLSEVDDAIGSAYGLNKDLEVTQWNGVTYAFEPSIPLASREACIQTTDAVLNRIGTSQPFQINVYATATYNETCIKKGTIFTHSQNWKSPDYIAAILQELFGEYCNYGAAYGYASYLANAIFDLPLNICEAGWVFEGDPDMLDLNTLCFHSRFFTGKDVKTAKWIANTFVCDYISKNGEAAFQTLLSQSGSIEGVGAFVTALSDFYTLWDIHYTPSDLLFRFGGKGYDYIVKCKYAVIYMEQDWKDRNTGLVPMYYDGFLHNNYSDIKQYYTTITKEMGQYQDLFSLDSYNNDLSIYFTNHYSASRSGDYIPAKHAIALPYVNSLSVLYIESLVGSLLPQDMWAYSGTLAYFSYYYDYYGNTEQTYVANMTGEYETLEFYRKYRAKLGRDVDIFTDYVDLTHFYAYTKGYKDPNKGAADSFIGYLISRFGEEKVIEIVCKTHSFGEHSYEELVADWLAFLQETYSEPVTTHTE